MTNDEGCKPEGAPETLGHYGALVVTRDLVLRAKPCRSSRSAPSARGDSFLSAMVVGLAGGHGLDDAFRYGMAAGSAALLTAGTDLCRRDDVEQLLPDVVVQRFS